MPIPDDNDPELVERLRKALTRDLKSIEIMNRAKRERERQRVTEPPR